MWITLPRWVSRLLCLQRNRIAGGAVANRHEQVAVLRIDGDARAGLADRLLRKGLRLNEGDDIRERARLFIENGAVDGQAAILRVDVADVGEKNSMVARVVLVQRHIEEARLSADIDRRHLVGDGMERRAVLVQDADAARLFGDQKTSAR